MPAGGVSPLSFVVFYMGRYSIWNVGYGMLDMECWIWNVGYWMLDTGYWILDTGY